VLNIWLFRSCGAAVSRGAMMMVMMMVMLAMVSL